MAKNASPGRHDNNSDVTVTEHTLKQNKIDRLRHGGRTVRIIFTGVKD